jgi:hypothetical protein
MRAEKLISSDARAVTQGVSRLAAKARYLRLSCSNAPLGALPAAEIERSCQLRRRLAAAFVVALLDWARRGYGKVRHLQQIDKK